MLFKIYALSFCCVVLLSIIKTAASADTCLPDPNSPKDHQTCRCKTSTNEIIDLYPLVEKTAAQKTFLYQSVFNFSTYYYRPCLGFTIPDAPEACKDVASCQKATNGVYYNLGEKVSAKFVGEPGTAMFALQYTSQDGALQTRTTTVKLECSNKEGEFSANGEKPKLFYNMTLKTKYACLKSSGLSIGSILLIVFFVLLLVYIIGGVLFLRYVRGARGVEQIPNYTFWLDLPALIKDGALFLFRGCKTETDTGYDRI